MLEFFRGRKREKARRAAATDIDARIQALEAQIRETSPEFVGPLLMQTAELHAQVGGTRQSLEYYGRSIDAYIDAGRFTHAAVACRKLIATHPGAVRPLGTLVWIAIGNGHYAEAGEHLQAYLAASRAQGGTTHSARQLRMMAAVVGDWNLREQIGTALHQIREGTDAARIIEEVERERYGLVDARRTDREAVWTMLQRATLRNRPEQSTPDAQEAPTDDEAGASQPLISEVFVHAPDGPNPWEEDLFLNFQAADAAPGGDWDSAAFRSRIAAERVTVILPD